MNIGVPQSWKNGLVRSRLLEVPVVWPAYIAIVTLSRRLCQYQARVFVAVLDRSS